MTFLADWFAEAELLALLPAAGAILGLAFGAIAQRSRFCLRSAVIGSGVSTPAPMAGAYAMALLVALGATQALQNSGVFDLTETRFFPESLPLGALLLGGAMFGAGMVLTRGCASRLTVLSAQGNLRAVTVLLIFAAVAYMTLRGLLAESRIAFTEATRVPLEDGSIGTAGAIALAVAAAALVWRSGASLRLIAAGAAIGLLIAAGWYATGVLLFDEFDPRPADSLAFTSGASDGLFFAMASTAVEASFPAGVVAGCLIGAFLAALVSREFALEGFEGGGPQMARYFLGAILMGIGGVLAGGCTIGAGLTGVSTLAIAPLIALAAIIASAAITHRLLDAPCARTAQIAAVPAE